MGLRTPSPVTFTSAFLTTAGFAYIIPIFSAWAGACGTTAAGIGSGTDLSFSPGFIRTGAGSVITVVRRCTPAAAFGRADARTVAVFFAAGADARAVRADLSAGTAYTLTRIF